MNKIDITPYIQQNGFIDLEELLHDAGFEKEVILSVRIDCVALAELLGVTTRTLYKYIKAGLVDIDEERRIELGKALKLKKKELQQQMRLAQPMPRKRQKRR